MALATGGTTTTLIGQVIDPPRLAVLPVVYHVIYKITNTKNGKVWFSRRKTNNPNDGFLSNDAAFLREYKIFGGKVFTKEILYTFTNEKDANDKEIGLIQGRDQSKRIIGVSKAYFTWLTASVSSSIGSSSGSSGGFSV